MGEPRQSKSGEPLRVGFYLADQNPHRDRTMGISVYTRNLIGELIKRPELHLNAVVSTSSIRVDSPPVRLSNIPLRTDHAVGRFIVDQTHPVFSKTAVDLWHYPKGFLPLCLRPRTPLIGTVHDVILQFYADRYPHTRSAGAYRYWLTVLRRSISRFQAVLTISEFSRNEILRFADRYKLQCPPITVTYEAPQWRRSETSSPTKQDFVLHLASAEPHKRTGTLLEFWRLLESNRRDLPELHLVGELDEQSQRLLHSMRRVRRFPRVSETELKDKFATARALIVPSEIEGFGLPALEAYEMRTPVLFAAGTPLREILGPETPGEFDLDSVEAFEAALDKVLSLDAIEIEKKASDLHTKFSWSRCADETVAMYKRVLA